MREHHMETDPRGPAFPRLPAGYSVCTTQGFRDGAVYYFFQYVYDRGFHVAPARCFWLAQWPDASGGIEHPVSRWVTLADARARIGDRHFSLLHFADPEVMRERLIRWLAPPALGEEAHPGEPMAP